MKHEPPSSAKDSGFKTVEGRSHPKSVIPSCCYYSRGEPESQQQNTAETANIGRGDELETREGAFQFERGAGKPAEVIADEKEIDDVARLTEFYAGKPEEWKKMKRVAYGEIEEGERREELHWYENEASGAVDYKVKE